MNNAVIEREVCRRASRHLAQSCLEVDYYRIRRRLAYPLPVAKIHLPAVEVPGIPTYPWATWMIWALEERIGSLGWAASWFGDAAAQTAAERDLEAIARWPGYRQSSHPDLCLGHSARVIWTALTRWPWVRSRLRRALERACERIVADNLAAMNERWGNSAGRDELLSGETPHQRLHNIAIIGSVGVAIAANGIRHSEVTRINGQVQSVFEALLALRGGGHSEGVAYDGYVLDFMADWLCSVPADHRERLLRHPGMDGYLIESCALGAPGEMMQVAELSDVEPREMPFHASAHAKLNLLRPTPSAAWYLRQCRVDWLRTDALAAIRSAPSRRPKAPRAGAMDAHYALVLRRGWKTDDVAVAMAASNSPMGHIHRDNGSLVIGSRGHWFITDPGYQQYMPNSEREFTIGPTAHNAPVINGRAQAAKACRRLALEEEADGLWRAAVDITGGYEPELKRTRVARTVWLRNNDLVVVADHFQGSGIASLRYHWHGHPAAAWWIEDGWARLHLAGRALWMSSPQWEIDETCLRRLRGSRGPLTLVVGGKPPARVCWWVFRLGDRAPRVQLRDGGSGLRVEETSFHRLQMGVVWFPRHG